MSEREGDVAGSLIAALAGEGEHVDEGGFTLDAAAARAKLRDHQLADPHAWILLAISAGVVASEGRGPIAAACGTETTIRFAGPGPRREQLEHLFASVFGRERELEGAALIRARVVKLLALAASAALSFEGTRLRIESVDERGEAWILAVDADGDQTLTRGEAAKEAGVLVSVRGRGGRRPAREAELVREKCRWTSAVVRLDDEQISEGPLAALGGAAPNVTIRVAGRPQGVAAYMVDSLEAGKALIINRGVHVETATLPGCNTGFVAVVEVDLDMDLSQQKLVRGEGWEAMLAGIRAAHAELPRPVFKLGSLASEAGSRPWKIALPITAGLVSIAGLVSLVTWLRGEPERTARQLQGSCDAGEAEACRALLVRTQEPERRRELVRVGCQTNDLDMCRLHARAVHAGYGGRADPESGLHLLIGVCEAGQVSACREALTLTDDVDELNRIDQELCRIEGRRDPRPCERVVERERRSCKGAPVCGLLLGALRELCWVQPGQACFEAGLMLHLGYGSPRDADGARKLFRRACEAEVAAACEWETRPEVSYARCESGEGWDCYALGIEIYWYDDLHEPAQLWFERACEAGLGAGCHARGLWAISADPAGADLAQAQRSFARACAAGWADGCAAQRQVEALIGDPDVEAKLAELDALAPGMALP